ncbi:MAG: hypothetical protein HY914_22170 [Desulfomonile tiedjei]|nr:hypothetical protein [Desulfomonile tiedjei]
MAKRVISAKEVVADIRAGKGDSTLMAKYKLAPDGLQSLFDKLVTAGFIDISELEGRLPGCLGTVNISLDALHADAGSETDEGRHAPKSKSSARIGVQEAARDIRSGMDDSALMKKYRLSAKGLESLFGKLTTVGAITQSDLARRSVGFDHTVSLKEDLMSFSYVMKQLGHGSADGLAAAGQGKQAQAIRTVQHQPARHTTPSADKAATPAKPVRPDARPRETSWYDNALVVILLLLGLFPLGFFALYRNSTLAPETKAVITMAWVILASALLIVISAGTGWSHSAAL